MTSIRVDKEVYDRLKGLKEASGCKSLNTLLDGLSRTQLSPIYTIEGLVEKGVEMGHLSKWFRNPQYPVYILHKGAMERVYPITKNGALWSFTPAEINVEFELADTLFQKPDPFRRWQLTINRLIGTVNTEFYPHLARPGQLFTREAIETHFPDISKYALLEYPRFGPISIMDLDCISRSHPLETEKDREQVNKAALNTLQETFLKTSIRYGNCLFFDGVYPVNLYGLLFPGFKDGVDTTVPTLYSFGCPYYLTDKEAFIEG